MSDTGWQVLRFPIPEMFVGGTPIAPWSWSTFEQLPRDFVR